MPILCTRYRGGVVSTLNNKLFQRREVHIGTFSLGTTDSDLARMLLRPSRGVLGITVSDGRDTLDIGTPPPYRMSRCTSYRISIIVGAMNGPSWKLLVSKSR